MYVGALLGAYDKIGILDVDLNLFSVLWAGNSRDFAPMARLLLEEGREVVALVDGDEGGSKIRTTIQRLNDEIDKSGSTLKPIVTIELPAHQSIEDLLPHPQQVLSAVAVAGEALIRGGYRQRAANGPENYEAMLASLKVRKAS